MNAFIFYMPGNSSNNCSQLLNTYIILQQSETALILGIYWHIKIKRSDTSTLFLHFKINSFYLNLSLLTSSSLMCKYVIIFIRYLNCKSLFLITEIKVIIFECHNEMKCHKLGIIVNRIKRPFKRGATQPPFPFKILGVSFTLPKGLQMRIFVYA